MYKTNLYYNKNIEIIDTKGPFSIAQYKKDLSVTKNEAFYEYFAQKMNVHRRQLICELSEGDVTIQAGAMQFFVGDVKTTTGIKSTSDFFSKALGAKVSGETTIKPEYEGDGTLVLEPTYKHILLINPSDYKDGIVLQDGLFLACESKLKQHIVSRKSLSAAALGNEGFFNLCIEGDGIVALESPIPYDELITINIENDEVKIDGSYAIAWSKSLSFTVEKSSKSLLGSAASGEGLVNVYRGSGKILMAPLD